MSGIEQFLQHVNSGSVSPYYFVSHASADNPQIRPVIERLIQSGVPLWLDKPRDIGLDPDDFVGSLEPGEAWTDQLQEAIGLARGLIYFPSAAYSASRECTVERGVATFLTKSTDGEYQTHQICLSEAAFSELDPRTANLQGTPAFVSAVGTTFSVLPEYVPRVDDLANALLAKLAMPIRYQEQVRAQASRFKLSDDDAEAPVSATPRDYSVPYRINRTAQRDSIRDAHFEFKEQETNRRPIFICHGDNTDETRWFVSTTIGERLIPSRGMRDCFNWAEQSKTAIRPTWPTCDIRDSAKFNRQLRDNLIEKCPGAGDSHTRMSVMEGLAKTFSDDQSTRVVASRLESTHPESNCKSVKDVLAHIEAWAGFWEQFPFDLADQGETLTIIPVFELVYDNDPKTSGFFKRAPISQQFEKFLQHPADVKTFKRTFSNIDVKFLSRLDKITPRWVSEWIDDDTDLFSELSEGEKQAVRQTLKHPFESGQSLAMRDWSEVAKPILQNSQIGFRRT